MASNSNNDGEPRSALVIGATGAVGKHVLREVLASSQYTRVGEIGRRVTPLEQLSEIKDAKDKLVQRTVDFEKIAEGSQLKDEKWDDVYITLATTRADAGSAATFRKIDHDYVVNAAQAAKTEDPAHAQRVIYCSSIGANANSPFLYVQSKGQTENDLASLGYADTLIFRPGFLANAQRSRARFAEQIAGQLYGLASHFTSAGQIDVNLLGKAMVRAGALGSAHLPAFAGASRVTTPAGNAFTVIGNGGALKLAKQDK